MNKESKTQLTSQAIINKNNDFVEGQLQKQVEKRRKRGDCEKPPRYQNKNPDPRRRGAARIERGVVAK